MSEPIIDPIDLGTYLGIDTSTQTGRLQYIIELAQSLCESIVAPLPAGAEAVVIDVVTRSFSNPANASSEGTGPFSVNWGAIAGGLWLTRQNKSTLRRLSGGGGAFSYDPTPTDAGQGLPPWDQNVTWLDGVPLAEDLGTGPLG